MLPKGQVLEYQVALYSTSYLVPAGHRLRVSVACSDFPRIWPTRANPLIRLACGGSHPSQVQVPVVPAGEILGPELPIPDPGVRRTPLDLEAKPHWTIGYDFASETVAVTIGARSVIMTPSRDGRFEIERWGRASVSRNRPDAAKVEGEARITLQTHGGEAVVVEGKELVTQFGEHFTGRVTVDGQTVFEGCWDR